MIIVDVSSEVSEVIAITLVPQNALNVTVP